MLLTLYVLLNVTRPAEAGPGSHQILFEQCIMQIETFQSCNVRRRANPLYVKTFLNVCVG